MFSVTSLFEFLALSFSFVLWATAPSAFSNPTPSVLTTATRTRIELPVRESFNNDTDRKTYEVPVEIPNDANGCRTVLAFTTLNTRADVSVDGQPAGACVFPGGELDITPLVRPGTRQTITIDVSAYPPAKGTLDFNAPDRAETKKSTLKNKGPTGPVFLDIFPAGARILDSTVETSVRDGTITFVAETEGLANTSCSLTATITGCSEEHTFRAEDLSPSADGTLRFTAEWKDAKLWDTHTPGNLYTCSLALHNANGTLLDEVLPFRFGFREVLVEGRDLLLNGIPIHLRAQHDPTATEPNATHDKAYSHATNLLARGWNHAIAGNYNFSPGCVSYVGDMLDAYDEAGLLYSFTLPSLRDFDHDKLVSDPDLQAEYRRLARWAVRLARRHPCVILYAMNHNATGYRGDMDPRRIGVGYDIISAIENDPGFSQELAWIPRRRRLAEWCRSVAVEEDPTRPAYHHESGDLGVFHTCNIYLDWAPRQERSEWLADWSERGTKPVFFVEWGCPHVSNWSWYRGPLFIHRHDAYHSLWAAEYAAEYRGAAAFEPDTASRAALVAEEELWATKKPWSWGHMRYRCLYNIEENYDGIIAHFLSDNWRCLRAWGATAMLPWDQGDDFHRRTGELTRRGRTFQRWNMPECAFIGGDGVFTDKRHLYRAGDEARKTLVILNDRRVPATVRYRAVLTANGAEPMQGNIVEGEMEVPAGSRRDVPVAFSLPAGLTNGSIEAQFDFGNGVRQSDAFAITVIPEAQPATPEKLLLYDPKGLTTATFDRLGIPYQATDLKAPLPPRARIVIGRESLTPELFRSRIVPLFDVRGRALIFEQTAETLSALGFRVQRHGLRQVFANYRGDTLPELDPALLRDWSGESTLLSPYNDLPPIASDYVREDWAGFIHTRVWRCRQRGTVSSVLPEKPQRGDWRALVDGGFALEYAPLLEQRAGKGCVTWCQLDVTGRTVPDPAADEIIKDLVAAIGRDIHGGIKPRALSHEAFLLGRALSLDFEQDFKANVAADPARRIYLATTGSEKPEDLTAQVEAGARVLCLGFRADEVAAWSPVPLAMTPTNGCYASAIAEPPKELNGLTAADWMWHGSLDFDAFTEPVPDGNEAFRVVRHGKGAYIFWQTPPAVIDETARPYLRITKRHAWLMLSRLLANLGCGNEATGIGYFDAPISDDDPYRYYRW